MAKARPESDLPRTLDEFVAWHALQPERWEFVGGVAVMMTAGSRAHTMIKGNIYRHLANKLAGRGCTAYVDGVELRTFEQSAIPDVVVSCAPPDMSTPAEAEPVLIVEVLSPSTEKNDQIVKWARYRLYPSLACFMLVFQDQRLALVHTRTASFAFEERWVEVGDIDLPSLGVSLTLDEIYEGVAFPPEPVAVDA